MATKRLSIRLASIYHFTGRCASSCSMDLKMPECEFEFEKDSRSSYEHVLNTHKQHLMPCVTPSFKNPVVISKARMQWIWDVHGKRYLDLLGGVVTVSVGHSHPKVVQKAKDQMDKLWHSSAVFLAHPMEEYAEKLTATLPKELEVCYFVNSGSEANDMALLSSRLHTGAFDALSLGNSYHGSSPYCFGLTAQGACKHELANGFGVHHIMNPDPYRGIWGGLHCRDSVVQTDRKCSCAEGHCEAAEKYANQLQETLTYYVPPKVAAFFVEPIQGYGGIVQYPKGYLRKAFELVRSRGGLCISDEIQTSLGRLGSHRWGFESHGVVPDIVTIAKGIGNGFPMGVLITTRKIAETLNGKAIFNTFGGNPIGCSAASAVLDVIKEENRQEHCDVLGMYFIKELENLRNKYDIIGDVRGKGLMIGVELVENKPTRVPLRVERVEEIMEELKSHGVLAGICGAFGSVIRFTPPMCITKNDVNFAIAVLEKVFQSQRDSYSQESSNSGQK